MTSVRDNFLRVSDRVARAAERAGRPPGAVTLIAVSKGFPAEWALAAVEAGAAHLGESRVQEAREKWPSLRGRAVLHLIGHLQSNKAGGAEEMFDLIHSVDRVRLVEALERRAAAADRRQRILIEVNTTGEAAKSGVSPHGLEDLCASIAGTVHLAVEGLMTIGPVEGGERGARRSFEELRELLPQVRGALGGHDVKELSMGMSGDFEAAVEEGATMVRVGSAIFGARTTPQAR
jgi:hypothetical protein